MKRLAPPIQRGGQSLLCGVAALTHAARALAVQEPRGHCRVERDTGGMAASLTTMRFE
jgi:hypothetical protein